jgi:hypothetical protein
MKANFYLLIATIAVAFYSCSDKAETAFVEIETRLEIDILIATESADDLRSGTSSSASEFSFSGESTFTASSFSEGGMPISNIQKITPYNGAVLSFPGSGQNGEIYLLVLEWGYYSTAENRYVMQQPIDLLSLEYVVEGESLSMNMDEALASLISNEGIHHDSSFKVKITGKSNFNIQSSARLEIPVLVKTETFNPRFELF